MEKTKFDLNTIKRLLVYMKANHKKELIIAIVAIIINTIANVAASLFLETLVDQYIVPLIGVPNPEYTGLIKAICIMSAIYLVRCNYYTYFY